MRSLVVVFLWSAGSVFADPATSQWQQKMALAQEHLNRAAYGEAIETLREALQMAEKFDPQDRRRWTTRNLLASVELVTSRTDDAEFQCRAAMREIDTAAGRNNADYTAAESHLAGVLKARGRLREAETLLRDSLALESGFLSPDSNQHAETRNYLAEVLIGERRYEPAETELNLALPVLERQPNRGMAAVALSNLAVIRHRQQRDLESRQLLTQSLDILRHQVLPDHPLLGLTCYNLASLDFVMGLRDQAGPLYREALECLHYLGPSQATYLEVLINYAVFLRRTGHKAEARALEAQAKAARAHSADLANSGMTVDVATLGSN
jgi:tetratricopeptide (TPR) repeat protein